MSSCSLSGEETQRSVSWMFKLSVGHGGLMKVEKGGREKRRKLVQNIQKVILRPVK